eukprot:TRINITY_DN17539_c0_g1_i1.p1 TRINITY_DN17539_c0_g1~~TRINITY_DN17539_c0_g1_i1.p1  ORF type:complete len:411 (+),score=113.35 TRINITY_DN17539_c0_g1_i1:72-1235(+)
MAEHTTVESLRELVTDAAERHKVCDRHFSQADSDWSGSIDSSELFALVEGMCKDLHIRSPPQAKVQELMKKVDKNSDGVLSLEEFRKLFLAVLKSCLHEAEREVLAQMKESARAKEKNEPACAEEGAQARMDESAQAAEKCDRACAVAACKSAVDASYQELRSQGVKVWIVERLQSLRGFAGSQYRSTVTGVASLLKNTKASARSRAAALVAGGKAAYVDNLNKTVKALDLAKEKAKDTAHTARNKAIEVSGKAREVASDQSVQATAAGAAAGTVAMGATGLATGTVVGAAVGVVPALFTFGLSIPIGAVIGGSAGLAVGSAAGAVSGGAAGIAYSKRSEIQGFKEGALKKASSGVDLVRGKAAASAGYLKDKAAEARQRLVGKKSV